MNNTTVQARVQRSMDKEQKRNSDIALAYRLKKEGYTNAQIGRTMGIHESSVRKLLEEVLK